MKFFKQIITFGALVVAPLSLANVEKKVSELEARLESLEYQSFENFFKWSGRLENRYDYATFKNNSNALDSGTINHFSTQLQLNMESKPVSELSFFGRVSMRKLWNDGSFNSATSVTSGGATINDGHGTDGLFDTWSSGRSFSNGALFVERAFINYDFMSSLTLSIGRLPTVDGGPVHLSQNQSKMGTYPKLAFSAILDGAALTHRAELLGGSLQSRLIYTPLQFYAFSPTVNYTGRTFDTTVDRTGQPVDNTDPMYSAMLDYSKSAGSMARSMNLVMQYVKIDDAFFGSSSGAGGSTLRMTNERIMGYVELMGIAGTTFDVVLSYTYSASSSRGTLAPAVVNGVYCNSAICDVSGNAYLATLRYGMGSYRLGYEYINTGGSSFIYDTVSSDPLNFYGISATQGHHVFVSKQLNDMLTFVVGYQVQKLDESYLTTLLNQGSTVDYTRTNVYSRLTANF